MHVALARRRGAIAHIRRGRGELVNIIKAANTVDSWWRGEGKSLILQHA